METKTETIAAMVVVALVLAAGAAAVTGAAAAGASDARAFGVTAGADSQLPVDGDGGTALELAEGGSSDFPTGGTATLTVPADGDVRVDVDASDPEVRAAGSSGVAVSDVEVVDDRTVRVEVENGSNGAVETLTMDGLRFSVPADASATTATWEFGDASTDVRLEPERLDANLDAGAVPRGVDGVPGETGLLIDARDARADGFHAEGERMAVYVPSADRDRLAFDTRSRPEVELLGDGCSSESDSLTRLLPPTENRGLTEYVFFFEVDCDVGNENAVLISDLRFNTTGAGIDEPAEFDAPLVVESVPVNATDEVAVDTDESLSVVAPEVSGDAEVVTVPSNGSGVTGDSSARVSVADDSGGLVADGSAVVVTLEGAGLAFDRTQELAVEADGIEATVSEVSATEIVLSVEGDSEAGDSLALDGAAGDGLAFNVSGDDASARLGVTTSAGGDAVTQDAGTTISVAGAGGDGGDDSDGEDENADDGGDGTDGEDGDDGADGPDEGEPDTGGDSGTPDDGGSDSPTGGNGAGSGDDGADSSEGGDAEADADDASGSSDGAERRSIVDAAPDRPGVTVAFESVPVTSITFGDAAEGIEGDVTVTVTPMDGLPAGLPSPAGKTVLAVDVGVPAALADESATLRLTVDGAALGQHDAEAATLYHYDAERGEWEALETEVVDADDGTVTVEATTPGFSPFALQLAEDESGSTPTGTDDSMADGTPGETATDGEENPQLSSIGGETFVPLVLGLVAVLTAGIAARRFQ